MIVDDLGQIYVVDFFNGRVMRWCREATEGNIVIGGMSIICPESWFPESIPKKFPIWGQSNN
jgi:hypothetical protein